MSMEFAKQHDAQPEHSIEQRQANDSNELNQPFATGPEETTIVCTERRATDIQPEMPKTLSEPTYRPVATTRERLPLSEQPYEAFWVRPGEPVQETGIDPELMRNITARFTETRQHITNTFIPERDGMDIAGADAFVARTGALVTDTTIELPTSQRKAVFDALKPAGVPDNPAGVSTPSELAACYAPNVDIAFIFRDPDAEADNGPQISDYDRVHELMHSDADNRLRITSDGEAVNVSTAHSGYVSRDFDNVPHGFFLSEGVPEYVAGQYLSEVRDQPTGFANLPTATYRVSDNTRAGTIAIPSLYVYRNGDQLDVAAPAFAATGLGHLIDRDPGLLPALLAGNHDPEARKEVQGRINAQDSGLYERLVSEYTDYNSLVRGLKHIRRCLGIDI